MWKYNPKTCGVSASISGGSPGRMWTSYLAPRFGPIWFPLESGRVDDHYVIPTIWSAWGYAPTCSRLVTAYGALPPAYSWWGPHIDRTQHEASSRVG